MVADARKMCIFLNSADKWDFNISKQQHQKWTQGL